MHKLRSFSSIPVRDVRSYSNVVSAEKLLRTPLGPTVRSSSPTENCDNRRPMEPKRVTNSSSLRTWSCAIFLIPASARRRLSAGPTPQIFLTGMGAKNTRASAAPMTEKPLGLSKSEANLARNLFGPKPIDAVILSSFSSRLARLTSAVEGGSSPSVR